MPFRLKYAPGIFQRAVDILHTGVKWKFALVHFEDIIVYSPSVAFHYDHLREVLQIILRAGLTLRLPK